MRGTTFAPPQIELAEVIPVVDAMFDALSHFEGEALELDALRRLVAGDAQIVEDGPNLTRAARTPLDRDAWLERLTRATVMRLIAGEGYIVDEVARRSRGSAGQWLIHSVVEEHFTREGRVVRTQTTRWSLLVRRLGADTRIAHVRLRRDDENVIGDS